jgi:hypothetical protein
MEIVTSIALSTSSWPRICTKDKQDRLLCAQDLSLDAVAAENLGAGSKFQVANSQYCNQCCQCQNTELWQQTIATIDGSIELHQAMEFECESCHFGKCVPQEIEGTTSSSILGGRDCSCNTLASCESRSLWFSGRLICQIRLH